MTDIYVGVTYAICIGVCAYGAVKFLPVVLLSDWAENMARERALRARAHLEALEAARQAYDQAMERGREEVLRVDA